MPLPTRRRPRAPLPSILLFLLATAAAGFAQEPRHPLDGLTASEHWAALEAIEATGRADSLTRFAGVLLHEPPKREVLEWRPGRPFRREAKAVVVQGASTSEVVVDLRERRVVSWREVEGVQPMIAVSEYEAAAEAVMEDPGLRAALARRGITDYRTIECEGYSPGYYATPEEEGRRLLRLVCVDRRGVWNAWGRPIDGLVVVWDVLEERVVRVIDSGPVPVPRGAVDFDAASIGPPREVPTPIAIEQPLGPSFTLDRHEVAWQGWRFHFRIDPRVGLVVSTVRYRDGDRDRPILYQGHLSEIFVPYMDADEAWYTSTFLDAGEYSETGLPTPLARGSDCPTNAVYFEAVFADEDGVPQRRADVACLFERYAGAPAWRHQEIDGPVDSRRRRDLVLRMNATIGNYDYVFDWVFRQDGVIEVAVGATGIDAVKAVRSRTAAEDGDGTDGAYGRFVAEHTIGINHDHFFAFRLDLDVDGAENSFVEETLVTRRLPDDHPRRSLWVVEPRVARTESEARLHMDMRRPAVWRVINPRAIGPMGYPTSYEIRPGHNAVSLLLPEDWPHRRAGFTDHHLWVTPHAPDERYAAGDYPTQSRGGDGLPAWTRADRSIESTDLVAWYTMGFHHVVRAEDWPVMPTAWHSFELRPFDFFARNPALDLPTDR